MDVSKEALNVVSQLIAEASDWKIHSPPIYPGKTFGEHADYWEIIGITEICKKLSGLIREEVSVGDRPWDIAVRMETKMRVLKRLTGKPKILDDLLNRMSRESPEDWVDA